MKILTGAILLALTSSIASPRAQDKVAPLEIKQPWLRAIPKGAPAISGYATITNKGSTPDRILGASIPMAAKGDVHTMTMKDGIMRMRRLNSGLPIAPGATVLLQPNGDHLMFSEPSEQIKPGQSIVGTIVFEKAGAVPVTFAVGAIGARAAPGTRAGTGEMSGTDMK